MHQTSGATDIRVGTVSKINAKSFWIKDLEDYAGLQMSEGELQIPCRHWMVTRLENMQM